MAEVHTTDKYRDTLPVAWFIHQLEKAIIKEAKAGGPSPESQESLTATIDELLSHAIYAEYLSLRAASGTEELIRMLKLLIQEWLVNGYSSQYQASYDLFRKREREAKLALSFSETAQQASEKSEKHISCLERLIESLKQVLATQPETYRKGYKEIGTHLTALRKEVSKQETKIAVLEKERIIQQDAIKKIKNFDEVLDKQKSHIEKLEQDNKSLKRSIHEQKEAFQNLTSKSGREIADLESETKLLNRKVKMQAEELLKVTEIKGSQARRLTELEEEIDSLRQQNWLQSRDIKTRNALCSSQEIKFGDLEKRIEAIGRDNSFLEQKVLSQAKFIRKGKRYVSVQMKAIEDLQRKETALQDEAAANRKIALNNMAIDTKRNARILALEKRERSLIQDYALKIRRFELLDLVQKRKIGVLSEEIGQLWDELLGDQIALSEREGRIGGQQEVINSLEKELTTLEQRITTHSDDLKIAEKYSAASERETLKPCYEVGTAILDYKEELSKPKNFQEKRKIDLGIKATYLGAPLADALRINGNLESYAWFRHWYGVNVSLVLEHQECSTLLEIIEFRYAMVLWHPPTASKQFKDTEFAKNFERFSTVIGEWQDRQNTLYDVFFGTALSMEQVGKKYGVEWEEIITMNEFLDKTEEIAIVCGVMREEYLKALLKDRARFWGVRVESVTGASSIDIPSSVARQATVNKEKRSVVVSHKPETSWDANEKRSVVFEYSPEGRTLTRGTEPQKILAATTQHQATQTEADDSTENIDEAFERGVAAEHKRLIAGYIDGVKIRRRRREHDSPYKCRDKHVIDDGDRSSHYGSVLTDITWLEDSPDSLDTGWCLANYGVEISQIKKWQEVDILIQIFNWHFDMVEVLRFGFGSHMFWVLFKEFMGIVVRVPESDDIKKSMEEFFEKDERARFLCQAMKNERDEGYAKYKQDRLDKKSDRVSNNSLRKRAQGNSGQSTSSARTTSMLKKFFDK